MPSTILVPLDFGAEADRALPVGRALADHLGGRLELVVVTDTASQAEADEREARAHARSAGVGVDEVHLRFDDDVAAGLLAQARESDATLCMASHASPRFVDAVAGSVSDQLIRRDLQPLVLVGPHCAPEAPVGADVLACVDGHVAGTVPAVAAQWAPLLGAKVRFLTVADDDSTVDAARPAIDAARSLAGGVDASWDIVAGPSPERAIIAAAETMRHGLVVVGSSPGRAHGSARGHVARAVVRRSPLPVLLAPQQPEPR